MDVVQSAPLSPTTQKRSLQISRRRGVVFDDVQVRVGMINIVVVVTRVDAEDPDTTGDKPGRVEPPEQPQGPAEEEGLGTFFTGLRQ